MAYIGCTLIKVAEQDSKIAWHLSLKDFSLYINQFTYDQA